MFESTPGKLFTLEVPAWEYYFNESSGTIKLGHGWRRNQRLGLTVFKVFIKLISHAFTGYDRLQHLVLVHDSALLLRDSKRHQAVLLRRNLLVGRA